MCLVVVVSCMQYKAFCSENENVVKQIENTNIMHLSIKYKHVTMRENCPTTSPFVQTDEVSKDIEINTEWLVVVC